MSHDIYIEGAGCCDSHSMNITYNLSPMLRRAGIHWNILEGMKCEKVAQLLGESITLMTEQREYFRDMNPENGWGDYDVAMRFIKNLKKNCMRHPDGTLRY